MFLSARWRSEKNKTKVVFKLHFYATQVGEDPLTLSAIPEDVGKPTITLEKGLLRNGSCYWENPVYETVKFTQEQKTGKINEKIYRFVVSKGSSKASVIGEISVDFANYAVATTNVSSLSLPLKSTKSGTVLHVKIQRVLESDALRDFHDSDEHARVRFDEAESNIKTELIEDKTIEHMDILSSGSHSSLDTLPEFHAKINNNEMQEESQVSQWEWLRGGSAPETSTDDSSNSPKEIVSVETSQDTIIEKLKAELAELSRHSSISELELQSLRKQIMKECKKGQDLSKELTMLKEERYELKKEVTQFRSFRERLNHLKAKDKLNFVEGDPWNLLGQLREELLYEKDLNANLQLQLQKMQDSNAELIIAVQELEDSLQQKTLSSGNLTVVSLKEMKGNESNSEVNTDDDEEQRALEKLVMKEHVDCKETHLLEQKITELQIYRKDKDELEMQMEQLELDYEILKQENHDLLYKLEQNELQEQLKIQYECSSYSIVTELETELKKQGEQLSNSLANTSKHEIYIRNLEEEMEKMVKIFEDDLEILSISKIEQEKRAIKAEEALRKMKIQNAKTAERLQDEFKKLSAQMTSTFDFNEKLAAKAINEASELRFQKAHLEEMLCKVKDYYEEKVEELRRVVERLEREKIPLIEETTQKSENLEAFLKNWSLERNEMESMVASLREETEKTIVEEGNIMENLKDEKESMITTIRTEIEILRQQIYKFICSKSLNELEKEKLLKQLVQLKNQSASVIGIPKEIDNLKQKIKLFEKQIKLKEVPFETSANLFSAKEKYLLDKMEELERQVEEEFNQTIYANQLLKVDTMCGIEAQESNQLIRKWESLSYWRNLKENENMKCKAMEEELKEMQGRYYEISVRLAEVEGERQKLKMTVRSLKNSNKKTQV